MSIAIACYVGENSFSSLTKVTEQAKTMLESWSVAENENVSKSINQNTYVPSYIVGGQSHPMEFSREDYAKYGWLFGSRR